MAKLYYDLIKLVLRKIEDVPLLWRAGTKALLDKEKDAA